MNRQEPSFFTTGAPTKEAEALLVTVITPTYNQAPYISACIESVLAQSHHNIEYLIYDACSSDGTGEIVARYLGDSRIVYCREPDTGQSNAINKGLDAAKGDIVCWLNSDDFFFDHDTLAKVCRAFTANAEIDIVTGDGYSAEENGALISPITVSDAAVISLRGVSLADYLLQPATFWRRNELRIDENLYFTMDWKFFLSMLRTGRSIFYVREYLAVYRLHKSAKTAHDSAKRKREVCEVLAFAGAGRAQTFWARMIYVLYWISEALHILALKKVARFINIAMYHLSIGRIFSC